MGHAYNLLSDHKLVSNEDGVVISKGTDGDEYQRLVMMNQTGVPSLVQPTVLTSSNDTTEAKEKILLLDHRTLLGKHNKWRTQSELDVLIKGKL